jgi:DNA excision repair protein ERCC-5
LIFQREAYKYPVTDESEEPFHWGFPKLSALRSFLHEELSWSISKVDDELTPIVQRIARRGKVGQLNKQATLDPFFDLSAGSGNYAPRRRTTANVSKRLLAVIKAYREAEARVVGGFDPGWEEMMVDLDAEDPKGKGTGKRRSQSRAIEPSKEGDEAEEGVEKPRPKPRKPRKKKSESEITNGVEDIESGEPKKGRPRRSTASSVSISEIGKESMPPPDIGQSTSTSAMPEIAIPKNGLRGSATGVVGSGKRKKAALKAWRDSTRSQDLGPS